MGDFVQLIKNENMKIYRRPRTWIMSGIMVLVVIIIATLWLVVGGRDSSMWEVMSMESMILFMLVTIFTVVIAAGGVADEFTSGTIKLLLIRPWSRSKILLSKYIANMMFAIMLAVLLFTSTLLASWLCFGINPVVTDQSSMVIPEGTSPFSYMLQYYAMNLVSLVVTVTLAFMLSTVFRSSGLAIGLSLFLLLGVGSFVPLLAMLDYKWIDYLLFMHLDLTKYIGNTSLEDGASLGFSLAILGAYYVIFIALTWYVFNKRDVTA